MKNSDMHVTGHNLYGGIMQKILLLINRFELVQRELDEMLDSPNDSDYGSILGVELHYRNELNDLLHDFPITPTKQKASIEELSKW